MRNLFNSRPRRRTTRPSPLAALLEHLEPRRLLASNLLLDINPGPAGSAPSPVVEAGNVHYFTADDGTHGRELWQTDGTTGLTYLAADVIPGPTGSSPFALAEFNDELYFLIDDGGANAGLWKSDGTADGTTRVIDLSTDPDRTAPRQLTAAGDHLYFTRTYLDLEDAELWKSDGTEAGTTLLRSYYNGSTTWAQYTSGVSDLTEVDGRLFYTATRVTPADGTELWATDGTQVYDIDINPGGTSLPTNLVSAGGYLYLSAAYASNDKHLYRVDPVTLQKGRIRTGKFIDDLTVVGNAVFFTERTTALDPAPTLWSALPTPAGYEVEQIALPTGVQLQRDTLTGAATDYAFFVATDPTLGDVLYRAAFRIPTSLLDLQDLPAGTRRLNAVGTRAFFADGNRITSLDLADPANTLRDVATDLPPGTTVTSMSHVLGRLVFTLNDPDAGAEPWTADAFAQTYPALSASSTTIASGEAVTFTVDIQPAENFAALPAGTVHFYDGASLITSVPVLDGVATWATTTLRPGTHDVRAEYAGDTNYYTSFSTVFVSVTGADATVTASLESPSISIGQTARVFVHVAPADPLLTITPGTRVSLRLGETELAFAFIDAAGDATLEFQPDAVGLQSLHVAFDGDLTFYPATSNTVDFTVVPAAVAVSLVIPHTSNYYGRLLPVQVTLNPINEIPIAEGTVELREVLTGRVVATPDAAPTLDLTLLLPPGEHRLRAYFLGSDHYAPGNSTTVKVIIQPTPTTTQLKVLPNADPTLPPRLKATVTRAEEGTPPGTPAPIGGKIIFKIDGDVLAKIDVSDGRATFDVPSTYMGRIAIFAAIYRGDVGFEPSTSPNRKGDLRLPSTVIFPVTKILGSETTATRLEATVETPDGVPISGGKLQFIRDDLPNDRLATATVIDGRAVVSTQLPPGMYDVRAVYLGSPSHRPSQSVGTNGAWIHFATRVDLMIAYTPNASISVGGLTTLKTIALNAVSQMNRALLNSDIDVTVRLVRLVKVDYKESGVYETDLTRLQRTNDGNLDTLHTLRNKFGADLVSLFVGREGADDTIGLAYRMAEPDVAEAPYGFSIVQASEANNSQFTLAHELGHNFGASHDKENATGGSLIAPFAYGYRFTAGGTLFHDIMSYAPGKPVLYFANPRVSYKGTPTGDPKTSDLARLFTTTAPHVSRYRNERVSLGSELI